MGLRTFYLLVWKASKINSYPCLDRKHSIVLFAGMGKNTHGRNFQRNIYPVSLEIYMNFSTGFLEGMGKKTFYFLTSIEFTNNINKFTFSSNIIKNIYLKRGNLSERYLRGLER